MAVGTEAATVDEMVAAELRAEFARQRRKQIDLCQKLGVPGGWLSDRLTGKTPMSVGEFLEIVDWLGISAEQILRPALASAA